MNHPFPFLDTIEDYLATYLVKKAPSLPPHIVEIVTLILPWLAVVSIILGVPALLIALVLSIFFAPLGLVFSPLLTGGSLLGMTFSAIISFIFTGGSIFFLGLSIPSLFRKHIQGWNFVLYAVLISIVGNILSIALLGLVLNILWLYILLQVKSQYAGKKHLHKGTIEAEVK